MYFIQFKLTISMSYIYIQLLLLLLFLHICINLPSIQSNRISSQPSYYMNDLSNINIVNKHEQSLKALNLSNYLWYLFQNRNINSHQSTKPYLYYTSNINNKLHNNTILNFNNSTLFNSQHYNHLKPIENVNIFKQIKNNAFYVDKEIKSKVQQIKDSLQMHQLTLFTKKLLPLIPNERPFHNDVLLTSNDMMHLLGNHNFNNEFMSFNKPLEAIIFPNGRLLSSTIRKNDQLSIDTISSLYRNRRSRKFNAENYQTMINSYDQHKKIHHHHNNKYDITVNTILHNVMYRLKLIRNFKVDDQLNELLYYGIKQQRYKYKQMKKNRQLRRILRELLSDYTACPLYYIWYDLGIKFWPRWIKTSQCVNLANTSCSLPPGMYCQEKTTQDIVILRYICPEKWPLSKCNWYRIHLPIVTECSCQCTDKSVHKMYS
ncbi:Noggin-3 [Schistosoma japonicum]|uniref:Noggin-3 n=1 Tax=Schistosoma japonicum TaxID=6182 RepID=A0A4Z2CN79_SCHJA|nr:Noggin-3 [Schistosoma japonicum]